MAAEIASARAEALPLRPGAVPNEHNAALAYDEAFYGPLDLPDDAVMVQQDRAYTSPIWYTPKG
mgnify:CR=1 FL=1